jgi:hypothetical protein
MSKVIHCHGNRADTETSVYIGRPAPFGNPFEMVGESQRARVIEAHRAWFLARVETDLKFRTKVLELAGKDLACWCYPKPCHGDTILAWLEENA